MIRDIFYSRTFNFFKPFFFALTRSFIPFKVKPNASSSESENIRYESLNLLYQNRILSNLVLLLEEICKSIKFLLFQSTSSLEFSRASYWDCPYPPGCVIPFSAVAPPPLHRVVICSSHLSIPKIPPEGDQGREKRRMMIDFQIHVLTRLVFDAECLCYHFSMFCG